MYNYYHKPVSTRNLSQATQLCITYGGGLKRELTTEEVPVRQVKDTKPQKSDRGTMKGPYCRIIWFRVKQSHTAHFDFSWIVSLKNSLVWILMIWKSVVISHGSRRGSQQSFWNRLLPAHGHLLPVELCFLNTVFYMTHINKLIP